MAVHHPGYEAPPMRQGLEVQGSPARSVVPQVAASSFWITEHGEVARYGCPSAKRRSPTHEAGARRARQSGKTCGAPGCCQFFLDHRARQIELPRMEDHCQQGTHHIFHESQPGETSSMSPLGPFGMQPLGVQMEYPWSHVEWPEMEDCWQQVTCSVFHDTQPLEMSLTNPQRELDKWPLNVQMEQPWCQWP
ncbi:unnamed protein product [Rangifer tarandus platyrhynchus]|uniref:Uncharacterized protein n=1 Tax=Rangifer tarandus platyrhynchus TaxID=3082113 RepID=A0ABN8YAH3_RANTA|nr:unnamed protein product [Rangifer tarandus platyrhynchus]